MAVKTYPSTTCPKCGLTSYNLNDIKYRYCPTCDKHYEQGLEATMDALLKEGSSQRHQYRCLSIY